MTKAPLTIRLAAPRGFCAGVERAIQIVEQSIERFGAPVYVRHEIVHNRTVVEALKAKGAIFVEELSEVPTDAPVVFSAHGVPKSVPAEAAARKLTYLDATCPLVSKVHVEAERLHAEGLHIVMIGHTGHPEVIGTLGQLPPGAISLVSSPEEAAALTVPSPEHLAYITQTTLSVDDTSGIVAALKARFPTIRSPHKDDICYATTNRQMAVKAIAADCDVLIVIGASNSSNSVRLVEVGAHAGASRALRIQHVGELDWEALGAPRRVGITAGASAPEHLVTELIEAFRARFDVTVDELTVCKESVKFKLPRLLSA